VIENIPQDSEHLLVVTQPVARVEAGATQQLRFILQSAKPLETERLKRVIFEGILPAETGGQAQVKLGVRQNIPVILRPASLPVEREPWKGLSWSLRDGKVQVRNASPYVVRLAKSVSIMPLGIPLDLPRTYVLPGEELVLTGAEVVGATVRLSPASTYGFAMGTYRCAFGRQVMPGSCAWRAAGIRVVSAVSLVVAALGKVVADEGVVFDAQVLKARGIDPQLAQYFRLAPRFEQGERQVTLEVNGTAKGRTHARFNENGELCADSSLLASAGIHAPERTLQAPDTGACLLFTQAIPEAVVRLLPGKEEVALRVPTHTLLSRGPIQRSFSNGGSAGLLNYDALLVNRQSNGQSSQYRNFSSLIGLNAGDWIVRSRQSYSAFEGTGRAEHLYAYAEHTWEKHQTRMQLGHLTLAAPLLAGGAFTGVQLQPETALSAMANEGIGSNTIVDGVAFSPARVEVRQSGVVIYTTLVPSGPFTLSGLPLLSLNLDLEVTVQEDSGSQHQFTVPSATLRRGNNAGPSGYTLALGQVRRFGSDDRETPLFAAATNSWRWRANTHLSAGLMGADQYQAFGWGLQQALSEHTTISAQHVFSSTPAVQLRGSQLQASLSTALGRSVSAGLTASQQTEGFRTLTDTAWNEKRRAPESRASQQLSASVSGTLENLGTLGAVVSRNATTNGQAQSRLGFPGRPACSRTLTFR